MKRLILSLIIILVYNISAQISEIQTFPLLDPISNNIPESATVEGENENELIMFWTDSTDLHMASSMDGGISWAYGFRTLYSNVNLSDSLSDLNALRTTDGRILVTFKHKYHYVINSDDNGGTWSGPAELKTNVNMVRKRAIQESSLTQTSDSTIWFVYNRINQINSLRSLDGITWTEFDTLAILDEGIPKFSTVHSHWDNSLLLFYQQDNEANSTLEYSLSVDQGETWDEPKILFNDGFSKSRPRTSVNQYGDLILSFCQSESTPFEEYNQNVIYWTTLPHGIYEWENPQEVTEFTGFNGWQNLASVNGKTYISFTSDRDGEGHILSYGIVGESQDNLAPPNVFETNIKYQNNDPRVNLYFTAKVYDTDEITEVVFHFVDKQDAERTVQLFDDGMHNDEAAGDYIFGNELLGIFNSYDYEIFYSTKNIKENEFITSRERIISPFLRDGGETFAFDNNNLWFPINDKGSIGDLEVIGPDGSESRGIRYEEAGVGFGGGFLLSGYTNDNLWANGVMWSSRTVDYINGTIGNTGSANKIHVVRSSQQDFYQSWIDWKDAVKQGADFYDGDGDGIYNPVDKNSNGKWDENEDKPNIIGDITAFTVYNDGVDSEERWFRGIEPQGIEIGQTAFSYNKTTLPELSNVIFVKYSIENMGTVADTLDSVYFGAWADLDIGYYGDDHSGTDTVLNSMYAYNDSTDKYYGINSPSCFISLLQGPPVYINGETFIDENGNSVFDEGIDTPLDSALNRNGPYTKIQNVPGAKNNRLTAMIQVIGHGNLTLDDILDESIARNYMLGKNMDGEYIDVCNWEFGNVYEEDCSSINPQLMYSGDPTSQSGWIDNFSFDSQLLGSTGPFELIKNEPIDIIIAYVVGRGDDHLSSITEARKNVQNAIDFYETNFTYTVEVGVEDKKADLPEKYVLHQNYPNPFNPSTTISYSLPTQSQVELKIFDVLGREVVTLVNKEESAGSYQIQFNASNLGSGVYFYRLKAGSFVESKKMILLK